MIVTLWLVFVVVVVVCECVHLYNVLRDTPLPAWWASVFIASAGPWPRGKMWTTNALPPAATTTAVPFRPLTYSGRSRCCWSTSSTCLTKRLLTGNWFDFCLEANARQKLRLPASTNISSLLFDRTEKQVVVPLFQPQQTTRTIFHRMCLFPKLQKSIYADDRWIISINSILSSHNAHNNNDNEKSVTLNR